MAEPLFSFKSQDFALSEEQKVYITEKVMKLATYDKHVRDSSTRIYARFEKQKHETASFEGHITIALPGRSIDAKEHGSTVEEVTDRLEEKLEHQIKRGGDKKRGGIKALWAKMFS